MKKLFLFLTLLSLVFSSAASAVEYVTLNSGKSSIKTNASDLIEVIGISESIDGSTYHNFFNCIRNGVSEKFYERLTYSWRNAVGTKHTGITEITINPRGREYGWITLKITNASEINKVGPTSVLILPENATGNYDLIVESSSDSVTWTPFHSQAVQSDTVKRLFRVRIVHKGQEEAKAKAEEK